MSTSLVPLTKAIYGSITIFNKPLLVQIHSNATNIGHAQVVESFRDLDAKFNQRFSK